MTMLMIMCVHLSCEPRTNSSSNVKSAGMASQRARANEQAGARTAIIIVITCCYHYRCVSYLLLSLLLDRVVPPQAVIPPCQAVSPPFLLGCQPVLVPPSRLVQAHEHDQVAQAIAWHTQRLLQRRAGLAGI